VNKGHLWPFFLGDVMESLKEKIVRIAKDLLKKKKNEDVLLLQPSKEKDGNKR